MRPFSDDFLDAYLAARGDDDPPFGRRLSPGGGWRAALLEDQGDFFTILGLPLLQVLQALRDQGVLLR